jgi:hypothetical protein
MPNPWAVDPTDVEDVIVAASQKLSEQPGKSFCMHYHVGSWIVQARYLG